MNESFAIGSRHAEPARAVIFPHNFASLGGRGPRRNAPLTCRFGPDEHRRATAAGVRG